MASERIERTIESTLLRSQVCGLLQIERLAMVITDGLSK
jgi:hypothetical protein